MFTGEKMACSMCCGRTAQFNLKLRLITGLILALFVRQSFAQTELDMQPEPASANSSAPEQSSTTFVENVLRICDKGDLLSNKYCLCANDLVNCDFSGYPQNEKDVRLSLYGYLFPKNTTRFCFCNTPPNVHLKFAYPNFLPDPANQIQRYDLFNLTGTTRFDGGFSNFFHGDFCMANVSRIPVLHQFEFGRGTSTPVLNVESQECCSPIRVDQSHEKPLLLIENSTIDTVHTRGIDDSHGWKTVIVKGSEFKNVDIRGIVLTYPSGVYVAFLRNKFGNMSQHGIFLENTIDLLMVKNYFTEKSQYEAWISASRSNHSNIVLLENTFWNSLLFDVDAKRIVSWFNMINVWDNWTLSLMNRTYFTDRSISWKYNLVDTVHVVENSTFFDSASRVTFADNVMGTCNCSTLPHTVDHLAKRELNRCFTGRVIRGPPPDNCSILLESAMTECKYNTTSVDFTKLCGSKSAIPGFPGAGTDLEEDIGEAHIKSAFIMRITKGYPNEFRKDILAKLEGILKEPESESSPPPQDEEEGPQQGTSSTGEKGASDDKGKAKGSSHKSEKSGATVPVIITLAFIALVALAAFLVYKYRFRFRFHRHTELQGSHEQFI